MRHAGSVSGLCARGGFEVSFRWKDEELESMTILSKAGEECSVRYKDEVLTFRTRKGISYSLELYDGHLRLVRQ